jgi:hypothetical protein
MLLDCFVEQFVVVGCCDLLLYRHCQLCIKRTPFELQPEDGFTKKPKNVANMIF